MVSTPHKTTVRIKSAKHFTLYHKLKMVVTASRKKDEGIQDPRLLYRIIAYIV